MIRVIRPALLQGARALARIKHKAQRRAVRSIPKASLLDKDGTAHCCYCDRFLTEKNVTREHVVPLSGGGNNYHKNIKPACRRCNMMKGSMTKAEFLKRYPQGSRTRKVAE